MNDPTWMKTGDDSKARMTLATDSTQQSKLTACKDITISTLKEIEPR